VYGTGGANDTITDFNRGEGDKIDLTAFANIHTLADVTRSQVNSDTVITFTPGNSLTLTGITSATMLSGDFIFQPPPPPSILTITPDTGGGFSDGVTNGSPLTLNGSATPTSSVALYDGVTQIGTTVATPDGTWSIVGLSLADGVHSLTATDAINNQPSALSAAFQVTVDRLAPAAPIIGGYSPDTGVSGDGATTAHNLALSGTAEAFSTVSVYDNNSLLGTATADINTAWTFNTATLLNGKHNFTATATDLAGNISSFASPLSVAVDNVTVNVVTTNGIDFSGLYSDLTGAINNGTHSATNYQLVNASFNHQFSIIGSGFSYDGSFHLTGGTITEIDILDSTGATLLVKEIGFNTVNGSNSASLFGAGLAGLQGSPGSPGAMNTFFNQYGFAVVGNSGNDSIPAYNKTDVFNGGAGNDIVDYSHTPNGITADLANPANNTGNATGDTYVSIEGLRGTSANDILRGDSNTNVLEGGAGADALDGGPTGAPGTLDYASYANAGRFGDTGGPANTGVIANLADPSQNTGDAIGDTYTNINSLFGSNFNDTLVGDGNDNFLRGRGGADQLIGNGGSDTADYFNANAVNAGTGLGLTIDLLNSANNTGDAFGDTYNTIENIRASSFNDTLKGDGGDNKLTGGSGADTFVFAPNFGKDTITDYTPGTDSLTFDHTIFADAAAVMAATQDVNGNAVIAHDANTTVTLTGVTTAQLNTHQNDFHFV
jgi:Ca2+-binding RTX toxin-like protein